MTWGHPFRFCTKAEIYCQCAGCLWAETLNWRIHNQYSPNSRLYSNHLSATYQRWVPRVPSSPQSPTIADSAAAGYTDHNPRRVCCSPNCRRANGDQTIFSDPRVLISVRLCSADTSVQCIVIAHDHPLLSAASLIGLWQWTTRILPVLGATCEKRNLFALLSAFQRFFDFECNRNVPDYRFRAFKLRFFAIWLPCRGLLESWFFDRVAIFIIRR